MRARYSKLRKSRRLQRARRHARVRKRVTGSAERPRLVVFRSLRNIEAQIIDDGEGRTILGISTLSGAVRKAAEGGGPGGGPRISAAFQAGRILAEQAVGRGIAAVVFDRAGYRYHGRVRAFAEGARKGGLRF